MVKPLKTLLLGLLCVAIGSSSAQSLSCPDIVEQALEAVENYCSELGRNQACYGNIQLSAQPQPDVSSFNFTDTGDIVDAGDILSLDLSPLDESSGDWGVALMSLQVDIPNTLPGQNITFILFGDVELENAASEGQSPIQAFYLRTGIGAMDCEEAPESGLLVQTPEGIDEVSFNINGVDVKVGSTVLFQTNAISEQENEMLISTVEGTAVVSFEDEAYPAIAGTRVRLPLNQELLPTGRPSLPETYEEGSLDNLPIDVLPREIEIAPPLEAIELLQERLILGLPPCDVEGLPRCEDLPLIIRDGTGTRWGQAFLEGQNCILRPLETVDASGLPPVIGAERPFPFCPAMNRASRPDAAPNIILEFAADEDGDGIANVDDACPFVFGTPELQGCPETPPDRDGDGLSDGLDLCPYTAGENRGCPAPPSDRDNDGIVDTMDECPSQPGIAALRGCPAPDGDSDGFADASDACPTVTGTSNGCPADADSDGIPDASDQCPNEAGVAERNGCPLAGDSDGDGLVDSDDACPNEPGPADNRGCPLPDSDGDGLVDRDDACPNEPGSANTHGCPLPNDTDSDGLVDSDDACPNESGPMDNRGCPLSSDSDGDGLADSDDACPREAGPVDNRGCPLPDSDGDGIADNQDECPDRAGTVENSGCPESDIDQDTVPDSRDRCPDIAGDPNNYGCPLPDSDQDGVPDVNDKCPSVAGDPRNGGCPVR
jgi:hypothetical protein